VAAGLGDYSGVDPVFVRLGFVALTFAGGLGVLAYALAWILIPESPAGREAFTPERAPAEPRRVLAAGVVLVGLLFLFRMLEIWPGDDLVWPALLAAAGLALLWKRSSPERRARLTQHVRGIGAATGGRRDAALRIAGGTALFIAGVSTFLALSDAAAVAKGIAATAIVVAGLALIFLPWCRWLVHELADERRERIRSQERAELAAHLHDSVLQTLALIQRRSGQPDEVVRLARRQERELRSWLYGRGTRDGRVQLAASLVAAADEVEELHGVAVETVCVGDAALDEAGEALVAAAKEAIVNAAKFSGDERVDVYLEAGDGEITVFVRDRGAGFDPVAVPPDRKGVAESIVGRMQRHGGTAAIHSTPGGGTEVELVLPRNGRRASPRETVDA
jgi:signal transduction histidine kinase/phage shock protein PspC (stress-responsive transcriptional regulator)